jgi:hypothetical protein
MGFAEGEVSRSYNSLGVFNSQSAKEFDTENTHPYSELTVSTNATGKVTGAQVKVDGQPNNADFSAVGQVLGSALGRALAPNNQFLAIGASTVIGAVGQRLAQAFSASLLTNGATINFADAFAQFNVSLAGAGASSVASFLVAELGTALHLDGFGGQLFNAAAGGFAGSVASQIASKMTGTAGVAGVSFDAAIATLDFGAAATNAGYGISSAIGSFLAHELVPAQTHEGAVGGQLLGAIGSAVGITAAISYGLGTVLNFIVPGVGSLIGTIIGTLIGDAFGTTPHPAAVDLIDQAGYLYGFAHYQVSEGGSYGIPDPMAAAAISIVNAYLTAVKGAALEHSKQGHDRLPDRPRGLYQRSAGPHPRLYPEPRRRRARRGSRPAAEHRSDRRRPADEAGAPELAVKSSATRAGGRPDATKRRSRGNRHRVAALGGGTDRNHGRRPRFGARL